MKLLLLGCHPSLGAAPGEKELMEGSKYLRKMCWNSTPPHVTLLAYLSFLKIHQMSSLQPNKMYACKGAIAGTWGSGSGGDKGRSRCFFSVETQEDGGYAATCEAEELHSGAALGGRLGKRFST